MPITKAADGAAYRNPAMPHIEMLCPNCGHQLRIDARYAGQKGGCVHCKGRFQVPDGPVLTVTDSDNEFMDRSISSLERMDIDGGDSAEGDVLGGAIVGASLSSLENFELDGGGSGGGTSAFAEAEQAGVREAAIAAESLGCLYWGLAFHLPPVALIWALCLPKGHSQKAVGLGVSCGFLLLAIALVAGFGML